MLNSGHITEERMEKEKKTTKAAETKKKARKLKLK